VSSHPALEDLVGKSTGWNWDGVILELGADEGFSAKDLKVRGYLHNDTQSKRRWGRQKKPLRLYVEVIGFEDDRAPGRNWGYGKKDFEYGSH